MRLKKEIFRVRDKERTLPEKARKGIDGIKNNKSGWKNPAAFCRNV